MKMASIAKWALFIVILISATTTYGHEKTNFLLVNGWSLPPKLRLRQFHQHDGLVADRLRTINAPQTNTRRYQHYLTTKASFGVRGGADEPENEDDDIVMASDSDGENADGSTSDNASSENAMQELRKKWSNVPATPSIAFPAIDITMEDYSTQNTLADVDIDNTHHRTTTTTPNKDQPTKAIIIMDGFCPFHGQYLSYVARHIYGAAVIHVLSDFMARYLYQVQEQTDHLSGRMPNLESGEDVEAWSSLLPPSLQICGIYCESDSGLEDAERLGVALGLYPSCHDGVNTARRDKYLMNQVVSEVGGLDVVKQKSCQTLEEAEDFAQGLGLDEKNEDKDSSTTLVVVKPLRGVASDDVHLCSDLPSLRKAFTKILQSPIFGSSTAAKHERVLVQEFATGVEYAVDVVCRDGERKAAALWRYDKRAVNEASFVYFATELVPADDEVKKEVCNYAFKALDALGVRWGLSHVEVIAETSPETGKIRVRLVEVNCRQHNTDFMPLTNACVGYNALDLVLAAHLGDNTEEGLHWDSIPDMPTTRAHGAIVHCVSHVEGTISNIRYDVFQEMEDLSSVVDFHVYPQFDVGNPIRKTVDIRSDTGWAHIMNDDEEEFRRDYDRLVELQKHMFEVEENK